MANLLDLPNELLTQIWDDVALLRLDVASFAAVNRLVFKLANESGLLERHQYFSKWHRVLIDGDGQGKGGFRALDVLKHFIGEPRCAEFVEEILFWPAYDFGSDYENDWTNTMRMQVIRLLPGTDSTGARREFIIRGYRSLVYASTEVNFLELLACSSVALMCPHLARLSLRMGNGQARIQSVLRAIISMQGAGYCCLPRLGTLEV